MKIIKKGYISIDPNGTVSITKYEFDGEGGLEAAVIVAANQAIKDIEAAIKKVKVTYLVPSMQNYHGFINHVWK